MLRSSFLLGSGELELFAEDILEPVNDLLWKNFVRKESACDEQPLTDS